MTHNGSNVALELSGYRFSPSFELDGVQRKIRPNERSRSFLQVSRMFNWRCGLLQG